MFFYIHGSCIMNSCLKQQKWSSLFVERRDEQRSNLRKAHWLEVNGKLKHSRIVFIPQYGFLSINKYWKYPGISAYENTRCNKG